MVSVRQEKELWDPEIVEIRTRSVEKSLEPIVRQVTTLVNHYNAPRKRGHCPKKGYLLVRDIEVATRRLVDVAECIADDFIEIREPMLEACKEARHAGEIMQLASREFAGDSCNSSKRSLMVRAARTLLTTVARLLCVADMADVQRLLSSLKHVDNHLKYLVDVEDMDELLSTFKLFGDDLIEVTKHTSHRQADLIDPFHQDEMAAAHATLQDSSKLLLTASKAYVSHPDSNSAQENRDYVMDKLNDAVLTIAKVAQSFEHGERHPLEKCGHLVSKFEELHATLEQGNFSVEADETLLDLKCLVEDAVETSCNIAESPSSNDSMKERIFADCRNIEEALSNLLNCCREEGKQHEITKVEDARICMERRTSDLFRQVQQCVIDSISDNFFDNDASLNLLVEAAELGDLHEVEKHSVTFAENTARLTEVADFLCSICRNAEGIKMVKISANRLYSLSQQVSNAAETLAKHPQSKSARENMFTFRDTWLEQKGVLTEAIDDITSIDDFLAASEVRIFGDTNQCFHAIHHEDIVELERIAGTIHKRIIRIDDVVTAEVENCQSGAYTDNIKRCLSKMKENVMPVFLSYIDKVVQCNVCDVDKELFIDSAQSIYECIRDIKKAVMHRDLNKLSDDKFKEKEEEREGKEKDSEEDAQIFEKEEGNLWIQEGLSETNTETGNQSEEYSTANVKTASALMRSLNSEQREKMKDLADGLLEDKDRLLNEVNKWSEQGNNILVLVKRICMIMMDLSDFARGSGALKTTMDVINAVERIANIGIKINSVVSKIAERCPYSRTKSDLIAYLERISLYSHQLIMTARVKADIEVEAIMSLDSAKSLIQTAGNLLNSLVLTVRTSYIASTKHRTESYSGVRWQLHSPDTDPIDDV